ncbi:MAG: M48 family metallopeptidase [Christensenellales bacterium]
MSNTAVLQSATRRPPWGSCSSKRDLNFNCLLMLVPPKVHDYVIIHALWHL